ncbi:MAG: ubiquinol-cytochrome c reductase iron-sulfur subunit [Acidobacteriaceae bacterium]
MNTIPENKDNPGSKDLYTRRSFFGALLGIGTVGVGALLVVPVMRYVLYPLYAKSDQSDWSLVGPMEDFANLDQPIRKKINFSRIDGWREVVSSQSVYVTKGADGQLEVLSAICPHLGCSVGWQQAQDIFYCPCHGGKYKPDGAHISGPPPRGMDPLPHKIEDGKLMVHFEYFRENVPNREVLS